MDVLLEITLTSEQRGWVALAVAVVCISFLLFRSRFRKADPLEKPVFSSLASQRSVERQMQNLLVELSEMSRQISGQIDTRAARLQELIAQADERIATLRRLGDVGGPPAPSAPTLVTHDDSQDTTGPIPIDPRHAEIYSLADQGQGAREIASRLGRPSGEIELILALRRRTG